MNRDLVLKKLNNIANGKAQELNYYSQLKAPVNKIPFEAVLTQASIQGQPLDLSSSKINGGSGRIQGSAEPYNSFLAALINPYG